MGGPWQFPATLSPVLVLLRPETVVDAQGGQPVALLFSSCDGPAEPSTLAAVSEINPAPTFNPKRVCPQTGAWPSPPHSFPHLLRKPHLHVPLYHVSGGEAAWTYVKCYPPSLSSGEQLCFLTAGVGGQNRPRSVAGGGVSCPSTGGDEGPAMSLSKNPEPLLSFPLCMADPFIYLFPKRGRA